MALHPSGLFVLVGFSEKLRLMSLLINDIRPYKEFPIRGCREVLRYIALVDTAYKLETFVGENIHKFREKPSQKLCTLPLMHRKTIVEGGTTV